MLSWDNLDGFAMTDPVIYKIFHPKEISSSAVMTHGKLTQITSISDDALVTLLYSDVRDSG